MKAIIKSRNDNAVNMCDVKETIATVNVVALYKREMRNVITLRYYASRSADGSSPVYASAWVRCANGKWTSGYGKATGCGYHKKSAAASEAIESAGISLSEPIGGHGDNAVSAALEAIARAAGYHGQLLFVDN